MKQSDSIAQLSLSLAIAQGELEDAAKSSTNPAFHSKYADLSSILQAVRPVLARNGLALVQGVEADDASVTVTTRLIDKSGEWLESSLRLPLDKKTPQGVGSCITYGRRYGAAAMVGITQDDDDGNAASGKTGAPEAPKATGKGSKAKNVDLAPEDLEALKAQFDKAKTPADVTALVGEFTKLTPAQQSLVIASAQAARARAGM